ncbi:MAG: hypothetical protein ACE5PT_11805 [Gemmatimonadales bacterium]
MVEHAITIGDRFHTGSRPIAVPGHVLAAGGSAARFVRTAAGVALFDDQGRFVGTIRALADEPRFGPSAKTVLLGRG